MENEQNEIKYETKITELVTVELSEDIFYMDDLHSLLSVILNKLLNS